MKTNPAEARVLIVSDNVDDASQILQQLKGGGHERVRTSTDAAHAVTDFEGFRPDVLVLAFDGIEKAELYSLGLYRQSAMVGSHRHRTVLLCRKEELRAAFDLCKKGFFDDYVLHWPMSHDGLRLAMSVWNAARDTLALTRGPSDEELLAHAAQIRAMGSLLQHQFSEGSRHSASAQETLQQAEKAFEVAIDRFSQRLTGNRVPPIVEVKDVVALSREFERLKAGEVHKGLKAANDVLAPLVAWPAWFQEQLAPHLAEMHGFATKVRAARWVVLVVEDDAFWQTLIAESLGGRDYELVFAADSTTALGLLRRRRPDLILMDINLPDIDGIRLTRHIRAEPHLALIPVIMLTGEARREVIAKSMGAGASSFIAKPFTRDALVAKLEQYLVPKV